MDSRISADTTLFSLLMAGFFAWTVVSVAEAATPTSPSVSCTVAKVAGITHS